MNRAERRRQAREQGKQVLAWERKPTPKELGLKLSGWAGQVEQHFVNGKYSVQIRTINTEWGSIAHAAITQGYGGGDIPWRDKQRIKNELFGPERVAIEVFPRESDLIDEANMYHLWVLPPGASLPFGLHMDRRERPCGQLS